MWATWRRAEWSNQGDLTNLHGPRNLRLGLSRGAACLATPDCDWHPDASVPLRNLPSRSSSIADCLSLCFVLVTAFIDELTLSFRSFPQPCQSHVLAQKQRYSFEMLRSLDMPTLYSVRFLPIIDSSPRIPEALLAGYITRVFRVEVRSSSDLGGPNPGLS